MKSSLIPQLKKLVIIDTSIKKVMIDVKEISARIDADAQTLLSLQNQIDLLNSEKKGAQRDVNSQEFESTNLRDQEQKIRHDLEKVQSTRDYKLKEKELAYILHERLLLDDIIIKVWHALETAEKKLALEVPGIQEKQATLLAEKAIKELELTRLTDELAQLEEERKIASVNVPADWLTKYSRMRLRVDDPIVPLSQTHCSSCYYTVPRQELANLKRDLLIICQNCYRFIYESEPLITEPST